MVPVGAINVADSLAAIKKLVFDEKKVPMKLLRQAMAANWEGHENIRKMCLQAPKYGNDVDYVDSIARALYKFIIDEEARPRFTRPRENKGNRRSFYFIDVCRRNDNRSDTGREVCWHDSVRWNRVPCPGERYPWANGNAQERSQNRPIPVFVYTTEREAPPIVSNNQRRLEEAG